MSNADGDIPKKSIVWKRSKCPQLYCNTVSGIYYARVTVLGKQKFKTLETKILELARKRLEKYLELVEKINGTGNRGNNDFDMTCKQAADEIPKYPANLVYLGGINDWDMGV